MTDPVSFWARRRAAVRAEEEAELRASEEVVAAERAAAMAQKDDAEILEEMGLPDPASLRSGDDFTGFLKRDVPEHLRRQALRTLWRSNPVLACLDGLNEYDDDYRAAMLLQEPIKTAYQVGKGMLKHIEEMERKAEAAVEEEAVATAAPEPVAEPDKVEPAKPSAYVAIEPEAEDARVESGTDEVEVPAPRLMRFRFEEATV